MNKGQSLFEVVVALAISALIIGAVVSLVTNSVRNSTYSKNQSLASNLAQQATEWLRGQRDADIATFITKTGQSGSVTSYCLPNLTNLADLTPGSLASCSDVVSGTPFIRTVKFTTTTSSSGKTLIEADIAVSWTDAQGIHNITSATSFTDWRQR